VLWLYRARVFGALADARTSPVARRFLANLLIAFLPAAILGFLFHDAIEERLFTPRVVALSLVLGGIVVVSFSR